MRTTVIIDDILEAKLRRLVSGRGLSEFINQCLREYFEREEKKKRLQELEKSYKRAAKADLVEDFDGIDREEWPQW